MSRERCPAEVGVEKHTGGVDYRRIGGGNTSAKGVEDITFEGIARGFDIRSGNLAGADPLPELVDCDPARLHDWSVAVVVNCGPQRGEVEQTMNRGDAPIIRCHERHSSGDWSIGHPIGWRH